MNQYFYEESYYKHIQIVKEVRNSIAHSTTLKLSEFEYNEHKNNLTKALIYFHFTESEIKKIEETNKNKGNDKLLCGVLMDDLNNLFSDVNLSLQNEGSLNVCNTNTKNQDLIDCNTDNKSIIKYDVCIFSNMNKSINNENNNLLNLDS